MQNWTAVVVVGALVLYIFLRRREPACFFGDSMDEFIGRHYQKYRQTYNIDRRRFRNFQNFVTVARQEQNLRSLTVCQVAKISSKKYNTLSLEDQLKFSEQALQALIL